LTASGRHFLTNYSTFRTLEHIEDIKLAGNDIKEVDDLDLMDGSMSIADNSTIMTAKPSQVTATSSSRLLRKQSSGAGSKAPLDTAQNKSKVLSRRSSLAAKYANMSLEKALALACPTLQSIDDAPADKLRAEDAAAKKKDAEGNNGDKDDDGFHTWEDPSLSVVSTSDTPSESKQSEDQPNEFDDDDFKLEEEEPEPEHYNANNPKLVVETIVSREEILMNETVFRGLLQKTKDTITKAVKDNLPPEVGEEVTDLVLNVRPVTKEHSKKPSDTTIGQKVRDMLEADGKGQEEQSKLKPPQPPISKKSNESKSSTESKDEINVKKPAQLTKNPSALSHDDAIRDGVSIEIPTATGDEVILKASNRPNTPKTAAKIDRVIGSTKVTATGSDKPPPPVAQFDLRSIKRAGNDDIQSARGADERHRAMDDRRRVNSARMDSESRRQGGIMHSRMTTNSTSTVRQVNSNVIYHQPQMNKSPRSDSCGNLGKESTGVNDDAIHDIDMNNVQVGMRRAGSAPLSTINSELDDDKSIQWNLMPPSELPTHVVPPPSTIEGTTSEEGGEFLTELGADMESIVRRSYEQDTVRPSSSQSGVSLT